MKIFLTGATGYIGGSVAVKLINAGHQVLGLTRSKEKAQQLEEMGIEPIVGSLTDSELLIEATQQSDAVINAADSDNPWVVTTILPVLSGTNKLFIQTSGSSLVGDKATGDRSELLFNEDTPFHPALEKVGRIAINERVLSAAQRGVHSIVLCHSLIYGRGQGIHAESIQIPGLIELARKTGRASHIGKGENIWSHVHIDDVAELYLLAIENAPAGSFFYVESGEASMKTVAEAIGQMLDLEEKTEPISLDDATAQWGAEMAQFAFGSNSRVTASKARKMLDWNPTGASLLDEIKSGYYHHKYAKQLT